MANRKLESHIKEVGWPSFLREIADLAREDAGTYGPRNYMLMLLGSRLDNLSKLIKGHVPDGHMNMKEGGEENVSS